MLGAWDAYCVAAVEEELRKKRAMVAHVTDALVQLRLAEHDRAADIRGRSLAATIAGPNSAQARRERAVAPRRAALTSAVSSQVQSLIRKLRMLGGDRAVAAAEAKAKEAVAAKVKETSRVTELPSDVPTAPVAAA
uniref:Uncharacterized protein n=1 Tax=Neobodo designis TaxID=312471 RepID=A0A7S1QLW3_NEODS